MRSEVTKFVPFNQLVPQMCLAFLCVPMLVLVSVSQCHDHHHDHDHHHGDLGAHLAKDLASSAQMFGQSVAAGLALHSEWFPWDGEASDAACQDEAGSASPQMGWPAAGPVTEAGICWRRRQLILGGSWGPWRYVTGTLRQTFVPNFLRAGDVTTGPEVVDTK